MTLLDHLLALALIVVMPIAGYISFQRILRRVDAGEEVNRCELYRSNIWMMWILLVATGLLWSNTERSWAALGVNLEFDVWFLCAGAATFAGIALLIMQISKIRIAPPEEIRAARRHLGSVEIILPHNDNELTVFYGVSITAGIVEETLWRGFMIWYLSAFMPLWVAALISVLAFGTAHAYQGASQIPKITLVGAAFTGLFFLSGSLWLPILLHAAVDILQGRAGYEIIKRDNQYGATGSPADSDVTEEKNSPAEKQEKQEKQEKPTGESGTTAT